MRTATRLLLSAMLAMAVTAPAPARDALGIFDSWGAFRDAQPARCFAIAEPAESPGVRGWRPFASVASWPAHGVRGQLHIRMSRAKRPGAVVTLSIGERRFTLVSGRAEAWAPDAQADAAIVAAMRSGSSMSISTVSEQGPGFADTYRLRGAATAIDAATLGCAQLR